MKSNRLSDEILSKFWKQCDDAHDDYLSAKSIQEKIVILRKYSKLSDHQAKCEELVIDLIKNNGLNDGNIIGEGVNKIAYLHGEKYVICKLKNNHNSCGEAISEIVTMNILREYGFNTSNIVEIFNINDEIFIVYNYINYQYASLSDNHLDRLKGDQGREKELSKDRAPWRICDEKIYNNLLNFIIKVIECGIFPNDVEIFFKDGDYFLHDANCLIGYSFKYSCRYLTPDRVTRVSELERDHGEPKWYIELLRKSETLLVRFAPPLPYLTEIVEKAQQYPLAVNKKK